MAINPLLRLATQKGDLGLVNLHIARGVEVNGTDSDGFTLLDIASKRSHWELCKVLLAAGADPLPLLTSSRIADAPVDLLALLSSAAPVHPADKLLSPDFGDALSWEDEAHTERPMPDAVVEESSLRLRTRLSTHIPWDDDADWSEVEIELPRFSLHDIWAARDPIFEEVLRLASYAILEGSLPESVLAKSFSAMDVQSRDSAILAMRLALEDAGIELDERIDAESFFANWDSEDGMGRDLIVGLEDIVELFLDRFRSRTESLAQVGRQTRTPLLTDTEEVELGTGIGTANRDILDLACSIPKAREFLEFQCQRIIAGTESATSLLEGIQEDGEAVTRGDDPPEKQHELISNEEESIDLRLGHAETAATDLLRFLSDWASNAERDSRPPRLSANAVASLSEIVLAEENADLRRRWEHTVMCLRKLEDRFLSSNLRLALTIARAHQTPSVEVADLIQEANVGLLTAVRRFDPDRGFRFSTYATWWIRQAVTRCVANSSRIIRLPVHMHELLRRIQRQARQREFGESLKGLQERLVRQNGISPSRVSAVLQMLDAEKNFEEFISQDMGCTDRIEARGSSPEQPLELSELRRDVDWALTCLESRDAEIIAKRFGLGGDDPMTLEEIAVQHNVTRERIRQIEAKSLKKLRHPARLERLGIYAPTLWTEKGHEETT